MPFFLMKGILFLFIIGFIFRMIWWRGYLWGSHNRYQMVMADRIRSMSEDEYNELRKRFDNWHTHDCGPRRGRWGRYNCDRNDKADVKKEADNSSEKNNL